MGRLEIAVRFEPLQQIGCYRSPSRQLFEQLPNPQSLVVHRALASLKHATFADLAKDTTEPTSTGLPFENRLTRLNGGLSPPGLLVGDDLSRRFYAHVAEDEAAHLDMDGAAGGLARAAADHLLVACRA